MQLRYFLNTIIGALVILLFSRCTQNNQKLYLLFNKVDGLYDGSIITSRGLALGKITNMDLTDSGVLVEVSFNKDYKIPIGSEFKIKRDNILQGKNAVDIVFSKSPITYTEHDTISVTNLSLGYDIQPIEIDSASKKKMIGVFEKIDTLLNAIKK
jgi:ABC-type transporter Mla subunit MlaD